MQANEASPLISTRRKIFLYPQCEELHKGE